MIRAVTIPTRLQDIFKVTVVYLYWKFINLSINTLVYILFRPPTKTPENILIFRTGSLGDSICSIPSILTIKENYPDSVIDILSNSGSENLVSLKSLLNPRSYNNYIDYLKLEKKEIIKLLSTKNYDLVVQLTQNQSKAWRIFRDILFFRFGAKISSGLGWEYATVPFWRKVQEKNISYYSEVDRLKNMLTRNGLRSSSNKFSFNVDDSDINTITKALNEITLQRALPFMALVVGSKRPQNRWPISYFKTVVNHFKDRFNIIIIGGPEDSTVAEELTSLSNVYDLCGKFTPIQSGLLLQSCAICISNDTGPMHLAYAFETPLVAIFSSRDFPNKWYPPSGSNSIVLRNNNIHCSLCLSENCTNNVCMQGIYPEEVVLAAENILQNQL